MNSIAYASPFIPPEWITAHGFAPRWLMGANATRLSRLQESAVTWAGLSETGKASLGETRPRVLALPMQTNEELSEIGARRGVCPFAAMVVEAVTHAPRSAAVVLATTCDQMRYAGSLLEHRGEFPTFVMNVPSTWKTAAAQALYRDEVRRLGRFLVSLGGKSPSTDDLVDAMREFDRARRGLREVSAELSARQFSTAMVSVRKRAAAADIPPLSSLTPGPSPASGRGEHTWTSLSETRFAGREETNPHRPASSANAIPLALVGGPLVERDFDLLDWIEAAGGRIVLNATEGGERTLPREFEADRLRSDPFEELADAYFGAITDVFRRPNDAWCEYIARESVTRGVRGLIFRRYLGCDLWHAELARLKAVSPVPVLDLDAAQSETSALSRTLGRIEAFLETVGDSVAKRQARFELKLLTPNS